MFGIRTRGCRVVCPDGFTELWKASIGSFYNICGYFNENAFKNVEELPFKMTRMINFEMRHPIVKMAKCEEDLASSVTRFGTNLPLW